MLPSRPPWSTRPVRALTAGQRLLAGTESHLVGSSAGESGHVASWRVCGKRPPEGGVCLLGSSASASLIRAWRPEAETSRDCGENRSDPRRSVMKHQSVAPEAAAHALRAVSLPDVATPTEVARHLHLSPSAVRAHLRAGRLPGRRVGNRWFIPREALLRALTDNAAGCPSPARVRPSGRAMRILRGEAPVPQERGSQ